MSLAKATLQLDNSSGRDFITSMQSITPFTMFSGVGIEKSFTISVIYYSNGPACWMHYSISTRSFLPNKPNRRPPKNYSAYNKDAEYSKANNANKVWSWFMN